MAQFRHALPQLGGELFLTDGGIETTLIFHDGLDLPYFAAFDLLKDDAGRDALRRYFRSYTKIAKDQGKGIVLETPTWRASPDWAGKLGYSKAALAEANRQSVALLEELRAEHDAAAWPLVISGCVGPRGDGYDPAHVMSADEAAGYHAEQIGTFAETAADMITAITMTNVPEATGLTQAARDAGMPVVISFTVETDGRLPTGETLRHAIEAVDDATGNGPAYYMINCAHPTHFEDALAAGEAWVQRLRGLRANASTLSHAELDEAEALDEGNPQELGAQYRALKDRLPQMIVFGGCCGTDHRHIDAIGRACTGHSAAA